MEETGVILSEEDQSQFQLFHAVIDDDTSMIANEKSKRNDNSRAAISIGIAMLCGKSVKASGLKSATSTAFGINRRRIAQSKSTGKSGIGVDVHAQKDQGHALSERERTLAFEFWEAPATPTLLGIRAR